MKKKQAVMAGFALVLVAGVVLAFWLFFKTKLPKPMRTESSTLASSELQRPDLQVQPFQKDTAKEEEKRAAVPQGKLKSWAKGPDGKTWSFASATWVMEQQRIAPGGLIKEQTLSWVWIKGDRRRVDTFRTLGSWAGTASQPTVVAFVDRNYEYVYYPDRKKMLKTPRTLGLEALSDRMVKKRSEEKIGREMVDGKTCETYLLINEVNVAGLATVAMEVRESRWQGLVLKSVSKTLGATIRDTLVTELKDVRLDVPVPDEKFLLPTGVAVEEIKAPPEEAVRASLR